MVRNGELVDTIEGMPRKSEVIDDIIKKGLDYVSPYEQKKWIRMCN